MVPFVPPPFTWLKQKCLFIFMEPEVKYICTKIGYTHPIFVYFIICLNHKFVQIPSLSKSDSCLKS